MKVSVTIVIDVDPEAWTMNYGVRGAREIRKDVKTYVTEAVIEHFRGSGVLTEGS